MTFTDAELILLGWAIGATVMWARAHADKEQLIHIIKDIITNKDARDFMVSKWEEHQRKHGV